MFGLGDIFEGISSTYNSVGDFFDDLTGTVTSAIGGMDELRGGGSGSSKASPSGAMSSKKLTEESIGSSLSYSEMSRMSSRLSTATTSQRRQIREAKLGARPEAVSYGDMERIWMQRLRSIAQGSIESPQ